jgi:hypothetical protein
MAMRNSNAHRSALPSGASRGTLRSGLGRHGGGARRGRVAAAGPALAKPGQVLVSNVVAELCLGKDFLFDDLGEAHLKGFDRPIRVHAVQVTG